MLPGQNIEWEEVWDTFKIGFATPVDYNTRFRMIIGDLATRSKRGEGGGCRLGFGCTEEKHIHIVQCPKLQGLWWKLRGILEALRGRRFVDWDQTVVLGWSYTKKQRSSGHGGRGEAGRHGLELNPGRPFGRVRVGPARVPRIPRIAMEWTAYGRTNASLTRLRGSAQRPAEGKGLDRGFSLRQNLTPNRTARLVISGGSIVTPRATSIMV